MRKVRDARLPPQPDRIAIRKAAGLTLREMATALPVSHTTLHAWEMGNSTPRLADAIAYRDLLEALRKATNDAS